MQKMDKSFRTVVLLSIGGGALLALLTWVSSGQSWYARRQWDKVGLSATFDHVENDRAANKLVFWYKVENKTARDYHVDETSDASLFVKSGGQAWFGGGYQLLPLRHPISVPAGSSALVRLEYGRAYPQVGAEPSGTSQQELISFINTEYASLGGFVLYDRKLRYELDFGIDWKNKAFTR